jgi:hypothetical protein
MVTKLSWTGMYRAAPPQFAEDLSVDIAATRGPLLPHLAGPL